MKEKTKNTSNDDKIIAKFVLLIALAFLGGMAFSMIFNMVRANLDWDVQAFIEALKQVLVYIMPVVTLILNLGMAVVSIGIYRSAKKQVAMWDGEDEEIIDAVEDKLNIPILIVSGMMVINCLLFALNVNLTETVELPKLQGYMLSTASSLIFILGFVIELMTQKKVVDLEKQLNPEKRGNVFDTKFQEVWTDSCDEAQKLIIYKAGYQSFKITNYVCMAMWVISFIAQLMFQAGILPVICVAVIWMTLVMTYSISSYRLEKRK